MPNLTEQQAKFVRLAAENGNHLLAATAAGYAHPSHSVYILRNTPHVMAALAEQNRRTIHLELAPKAIAVLRELLDKDVPQKIRLDAAKTVLDRAGYIAPKAQEIKDELSKSPSEMEPAELERFVARARQNVQDGMKRQADLAKPVIDSAAEDVATASQLSDILE